MTVSDRAVAIWIAVIAAAIYVAAGIGLATDYDYYGRLADAFLHGRWWLTEAPPWLNELLPCGEGRACARTALRTPIGQRLHAISRRRDRGGLALRCDLRWVQPPAVGHAAR